MHRLGRDIHIFGEQIKTEVIAIINYKIFRTNRINLCIPHPYLSTLLFVKGFRNRPFTLTIIALCTAIAIINYKIFRTNRINLCIPHPYLSTLLFVKGFRNRPFTLTIIALCTAASHLFTSTCLFNFLLLSFFIHSIG